jgi:uncharacterized protein (DUF362 family)
MISDRRQFLAQLGLAGTVGVLAPSLSCAQRPADAPSRRGASLGLSGKTRVVIVKGPVSGLAGARVDRVLVRRMLETGLRKLAATDDARAALQRWLRPVDTAGLKVNCLAGRGMSTHLELVEELVGLMERMGLPRRQAIVFDRSDGDLHRAGYTVRSSGQDYLCLGNDRGGYEEELTVMKSGASRFSSVAVRKVSVLINLPVLKDHGLAGISGALKNNFGLIHNPNKYHLNGCDPHVAEINAQGVVRDKQVLVICDALRVQLDGGPAYHPAHAESYGGLLLATDAVALDTVAWELLENLRAKRKLPSLTADKRRPVHILGAARQGLGIGERQRIEVIEAEVS